MAKTKKRASVGRVLWKIFVGLVTTVVTLLCVIYLGEKLLFAPFFVGARAEMRIPGLWSGFVTQGFDKVEEGTYLVSGYDKNDGPSSIYVYQDGKYTTCELFDEEGKANTTHAGGVAHFGQFVYVAHGEYCDVYSLSDVLDGDGKATRTDRVKTANQVSFCYVADGKLYAGAFYRAGSQYLTPDEHHLTTAAGDQNTALIMVYSLNETTGKLISESPEKLYSITSNVQGMCITDSGKIVLSTSWGLTPSKLLVYDETNAQTTTLTIDGAQYPTTVLDSACLTRTVTAPPMAEELVYENGRVTIMCESASMKYLFGKFTSGNWAYSVAIG
ncbi:MAG: hypothetical protein IJX81_00545 [Clostridia bacterium]|nr:hypothetical protein [Clostridia bacterium]